MRFQRSISSVVGVAIGGIQGWKAKLNPIRTIPPMQPTISAVLRADLDIGAKGCRYTKARAMGVSSPIELPRRSPIQQKRIRKTPVCRAEAIAKTGSGVGN